MTTHATSYSEMSEFDLMDTVSFGGGGGGDSSSDGGGNVPTPRPKPDMPDRGEEDNESNVPTPRPKPDMPDRGKEDNESNVPTPRPKPDMPDRGDEGSVPVPRPKPDMPNYDYEGSVPVPQPKPVGYYGEIVLAGPVGWVAGPVDWVLDKVYDSTVGVLVDTGKPDRGKEAEQKYLDDLKQQQKYAPETLTDYDKLRLQQEEQAKKLVEDAMGKTIPSWKIEVQIPGYKIRTNKAPCFAKGTPILTPFGEISIEKLKVGDKVLAFDPVLENGRGRLVAKEVTQLFLNATSEFLKLTWEENGETKEVITTPGHHFLREGGQFGPISESVEEGIVRVVLKSGDVVTCQVEAIVYSAETAKLFDQAKSHGMAHSGALALELCDEWESYNFEVEGCHTYVAGGIRVHNDCTDSKGIEGEEEMGGLHEHNMLIGPIILDLDGDGIQVTRLDQSTIFMDAGGDGLEHRTAWAASGDGVLFYDPDGRDAITEKRQFVFTEWDPTATSDMEALASVFDSNGDGVLSAEDEAFAQFKVLVTNADGSTSVKTLSELGITEINLTADASNIELSDGSVIAGQTTFTRADGTTGTVGDMKLAAESQGYRVEQVEGIDGAGARTLITTAYESDGSKAYEIHSVTSADGLVLTNRYDDNGDGVTNRIQSIVTVVGSDGSRTQTESNFAGSDMASAVLRSRIQTTTSADGNTLTIERDMTGGGWFDEREVRIRQSDDSLSIVMSELAQDGSVITSRSETVSADGSERIDGSDLDGDGRADTVETHQVTTLADDSRTGTITTTNQDGSLRSYAREEVSADGRSKVVERDLDGDGDTDSREELEIVVSRDGQTTSELLVRNGDGSLRSATITTQSADALSRTSVMDLDGDGDTDVSVTEQTVIHADDSRETIITQLNGDGSVRSMRKDTLGADKVAQQTWIDLNQNGSFEADELVSSVVSDAITQDRIATSWTRNADGSVNASVTSTTSADGLHTVVETDLDGDGDTDVRLSDTTSFNADGSATRTMTTRNQDNSLVAQVTYESSADGLTTTTTRDLDGDGTVDERLVESLALEADGGTTQTTSLYSSDGTLLSQSLVVETADRRQATVTTDLDGDGAADRVSVRQEHTNGSVTLTEIDYASDGTVSGQSITSSSANGLIVENAIDLDGDLAADITAISTTTLHADGSKTTVSRTQNADQSLRSASSVTSSDDGLEVVTSTDQDGDGTWEQVVSDNIALEQDGSTTRTVQTRSADDTLLAQVQTHTSDDGLITTTRTDSDGDGSFELTKTSTTTLENDGSTITTRQLREPDGTLRSSSERTVSDNGRQETVLLDDNGDGQIDTVFTKSIADNGITTSTTRQQDAEGELQNQSQTVTSANGLSVSTLSDRDGDGVFETTVEAQNVMNADGSQTTTTTLTGQDGTVWSQTTEHISDDGLSSSLQEDRNGDGRAERTSSSQTELADDGSQESTTTVTARNGSLLSEASSHISGDGRVHTVSIDQDGNGRDDEIITTQTEDDGSVTTTTSTWSVSGNLLSTIVSTQSGNALEQTLTLDLDGNGHAERTMSDVTVLQADGSSTRTVTHESGYGPLLARQIMGASDGGLEVTIRTDRDGDYSYESQTTSITSFADNGEVSETSVTKDAAGSITGSSTLTTSGDGLKALQSTDFNGDGTTNRATSVIQGAAGGSTRTVELHADDGGVLRSLVESVSADERSYSLEVDLDGDGNTDQQARSELDQSNNETTTYTQLAQDGATLSEITQTTSANGLEQSYAFDLDGDGDAEITRTTTTTLDTSGSQVRVFEEKYEGQLYYSSTAITSANGLSTTTRTDIDGDGIADLFFEDETVLHDDGSTTLTSTDWYRGGELRSSYYETTSADGRTITKTYDFDGDQARDKTEVAKVLADGSQTIAETAYDDTGVIESTAITKTSADGLVTTIEHEGITQTITRSVLKDGSYGWDNGVTASSTQAHIVVSHEFNSQGLETWRMEETFNGTTTVTTQRLDETARSQLLKDAAQVYDSVLDRDMEAYEVELLLSFVTDGQLDAMELADHLLSSEEYEARYGPLSDVGFISRAFQSTFGRTPLLSELGDYLLDLKAGTLTRAQLMADLAQSVENQVVGNGHGETNNPDIFLMPFDREEELMASFGIEGASFNTNEMEVLVGTDVGATLRIDDQDIAFSGDGDDIVTGSSGGDIIYGGEGNDTLKGGAGNDIYIYRRGDDHDTISEGFENYDILVLPDLLVKDVFLTQEGDDLVIYILNTDDLQIPLAELEGSIRIENWDSSTGRLYLIRFADGFELNTGHIERTIREGNLLDDRRLEIWGTDGNDLIIGGALDDYIHGSSGNDTIDPGSGAGGIQNLRGNDGD
ncbi:DUF4214 domain-containing protein, partial [Pseudovibrio axinellae]|uniref:DUF4214 domain-containing protein n=1 Tax=Pseudovibrio axinellae TaxID=989403 RepID=UPI000AD95623